MMKKLTALLLMLASTTCMAAITFTSDDSTQVDFGSIWCIPVYDGENLVVSTESGSIYVGKYDLDLSPDGAAVEVASTSDTGGESISDHKHIFQDGYHYITFSTSGDGSGGYLYLLKLDSDLSRAGFTTVVSNDAPTNDMFLVGDGDSIYVGKFEPGTGHKVYEYNDQLVLQGSPTTIGGFDSESGNDYNHANGASVVYSNGKFHLVAPESLAPGDNDLFFRITFDQDWEPIGRKEVLLEDPGNITIVSGLSIEPITKNFIVHYTHKASDQTEIVGPIYRAVFDSDWNEVEIESNVISGDWERPHSVIVDNKLFVGYDGQTSNGYEVFLDSFDYSVSETLADVQVNGWDDPVTLSSSDTLSFTISLNAGDRARQQADWWVLAYSPFGWFSYDLVNSSWQFIGQDFVFPAPSKQGATTDMASTELLNISGLPAGSYALYFGIDEGDGELTIDENLIYDFINVTVQ